jgi:hypothetical protein
VWCCRSPGVVAVLHCAASVFGGYWFDEMYMLAIGRHHLDWGSADQPPLAPALAALMDTIAPGSLVALRLPTVLATTGAVVVAGLADRTTGVVGSNLATDSHVDRVLKSGPSCYSLW